MRYFYDNNEACLEGTDHIEEFYFKGIKVNNINLKELRNLIDQLLHHHSKAYFCLTDVGNAMMAQEDTELSLSINQSTISIPDGMPLAWFGKLIGHKKVERISGVQLFQELIHHSDYSHFLLGDSEKTQARVILKAKKVNSDAHINCFSPPFKTEFSKFDNQNIIKRIEKKSPDIIWVAFGGGRQEKWMRQNVAQLKRGIMIGVGAAFKFYIGDLIIPPQIIQNLGLQWATRFKNNPTRWLKRGQFKYKVLFSLNFPYEVIKAKNSTNLR